MMIKKLLWTEMLAGLTLLLTACGTTTVFDKGATGATTAAAPAVTLAASGTPGVGPTLTSTPLTTDTLTPLPTEVLTPTVPAEPSHAPTPTLTPTATPAATPTKTRTPSLPVSPTPQRAVELSPPMIIDSEASCLYMPATVDGTERIVALAATDGQLLAAYDVTGTFAVDGVHGWLYVDQDETGLNVLDAKTGVLHAIIPLPSNKNEWREDNPAPQADSATGQVLAFRDNVVYIIDPNQGAVMATIPFDIFPKDRDCRVRTDEPLPIEWTTYDSTRRLLYLSFLTYVCTPWFVETIVSYDLNAGAEIARQGYSAYPQAIAYDGYLYGSNWYRMGVGYRWAWRDGRPWFMSGDWSSSATLYVDPTRGRLYESGELFRVFDAQTMALLINIPPSVEGRLVGYDPKTDQLYFLSEGQLRIWPASAIQPPPPEPLQISNPPAKPVWHLSVSPNWSQDRTLFGLWDYDMTLDNCYVFGASGGLLYVSNDGGNTWGQPRGGLRGGCERVSSLAVSPAYTKDRTMLAGIVGRGLFKSTDGGQLWQPSSAGLSSMYISQIFLSPGFERDQTAFAWAGTGMFTLHRSVDGGATWQPLDVDGYPVAVSPEFNQDQTLMSSVCARDATRVFLSQDGGTTWEPVGDIPRGPCFRMLSLAPLFNQWQVVFAYGNDTLYRSADGGHSWEAVLNAISLSQLVYGPETEGGRLLFLLAADVLYRSEDGGRAWQAIALPTGITPSALAISPDFAQDRLLFVGTADGQVIALNAMTLVEEQQ
jgi:photosystem II stability/assembly factor-like uncharacterized protein